MYSVLFSVLPAIQSFLAQLLGKVVALTIIIGDLSQLEHPVNKIIEKHVLYYRGVSGPVVDSERWTLGRTARVRVLDGALRCGLKQVASLTLLRLLG